MASPDPIVVERQMYLNLLNIADDPSYTLAFLRSMTAGGANVNSAANTPARPNAIARKPIRDFLKPVQIDSDAATLAQVDDPTSFIASPGSVVWDNYAAIGYPAGNPVPVTPGTPHNPGARFQPTGASNAQSLPFSFYANGKIGIHVTLWAVS